MLRGYVINANDPCLFVDLGKNVPIFHLGWRTYLRINVWRVTFG